MGGGMFVRRSLQTKQNKKNFSKLGQIFFEFDPFIFAYNSFSKIRSINSDRNDFLCRSWGKMSKNLFCLVSD